MRLLTLQIMVVLPILLFGCIERDVTVKDRSLAVVSESVGKGRAVKDGDTISIDYTATLEDGTVVLNQKDYRFQTGRGAVITGIEESVKGMKRGGVRTVDVPAHKHWGRQGYGKGPNAIPPNATVRFRISLTEIK